MKIIITLGILFFSLNAFSQTHKCGYRAHFEAQLKKDPSLRLKKAELENATQERITNKRIKKSNAVLTIPVVVHVIYKKAEENISKEQIDSQIEVLNKDFNNENTDRKEANDLTFAFHNELSDGANIRFELATTDPNGNSTTGITRTLTTLDDFDSNKPKMYYTADGGIDAWETKKYLNIWVVNLRDNSTLGYATSPVALANYPKEDGLVIRHEAFGTVGTSGTNNWNTSNLGRTATHEIGHWLNLSHIWGETGDTDPDCDSDFVDDTPPQKVSNAGYPTGVLHANDGCAGAKGDMYMNYMDYVRDSRMIMFSKGQVTRMRIALETVRFEIYTDGVTAINTPSVLENVAIYPNPSVSGVFTIRSQQSIDLVQVSDVFGRTVLETPINTLNNKLDLSQKAKGVYYLILTSGNDSITKKIIIQ